MSKSLKLREDNEIRVFPELSLAAGQRADWGERKLVTREPRRGRWPSRRGARPVHAGIVTGWGPGCCSADRRRLSGKKTPRSVQSEVSSGQL